MVPPKFDRMSRIGNWNLGTLKDIPTWDHSVWEVESGGKSGFLKGDGSYLVEPQFDSFTGGFWDGLSFVRVNKKWGFLNTEGKMVIEPMFEEIEKPLIGFREGLASVKLNGKWGYVNIEGHMTIDPQFEEAHLFSKVVQ